MGERGGQVRHLRDRTILWYEVRIQGIRPNLRLPAGYTKLPDVITSGILLTTDPAALSSTIRSSNCIATSAACGDYLEYDEPARATRVDMACGVALKAWRGRTLRRAESTRSGMRLRARPPLSLSQRVPTRSPLSGTP